MASYGKCRPTDRHIRHASRTLHRQCMRRQHCTDLRRPSLRLGIL